MPRTPIPNARCLASTDSPLLPFLAPRVFAESLFRRHSSTWSGQPARMQKEEAKETLGRNVKDTRGGNYNGGFGSTGTRCAKRNVPDWYPNFVPKSSGSLGSRFADISSFVRNQSRGFATKLANMPKLSRRPLRRQEKQRVNHVRKSSLRKVHRRRPLFRKVGAQRLDATARGRFRSRKIVEKHALTDLRRQQRLSKARDKLELLLSRYRVKESSQLLKFGWYRSLLRRVVNYSRLRPEELKLSESDRQSNRRRMLIHCFAALDRKVYPGVRTSSHPLKLRHSPRSKKWVFNLFEDTSSANDMWERWMEFDEETRNKSWRYILYFLLDRNPPQALEFLHLIRHDPLPAVHNSPETVADALEHLSRCYRSASTRGKPYPNTKDFIPLFCYLFEHQLCEYREICTQDLLFNLVGLASGEALKDVFDLLEEKQAYLHFNTLLHYANAFGEAGDYEQGLYLLRKIVKMPDAKRAIVDPKRFRRSCALVLRKSVVKGKNYHMTSEIVARLLDLGAKLDILLYNVIIHNAMDAGDYPTAFRVYNLLEDNGVKPDKFTYSILLYGCTTADNPGMFHEFAEHCAVMAKELKDPWLAADFLYYLYIRHSKDEMPPQQLSDILLHAYAQFFTHVPLQPFGIPQSTRPQDSEPLNFDPPPVAMFIMLSMEVKLALSISNTHVWHLFQRFKSLEQQNKHLVLHELSKTPHIYNVFLLAFCKNGQFANASKLITDMTEGSPQYIAKPGVITWTIFMHGFFKHRQPQAAERVFEIMRSRGVEPDQVTWQTMLVGYARAQMAGKVGEVMENVGSEEELPPNVLQALVQVHDRQKLMNELGRAKRRREKSEWEKAELERQLAEAEAEVSRKIFARRLAAEEKEGENVIMEKRKDEKEERSKVKYAEGRKHKVKRRGLKWSPSGRRMFF
ncbi:hypothetical protein K469DRAFT_707861 [Zopfia rhizophila CBS 207.26]|uniref:Pentacotripeptide-repeat region of PRORP domain-containing protein n=1 Tax=Zopfia rhizophila CBS 207.26 TaxID=1314779 RepID=A0A6A6E4G1_9PEZI|nr:hypothetical protein K469DRAFT_707861 [Zopfia rhizophila CBS 207.26]